MEIEKPVKAAKGKPTIEKSYDELQTELAHISIELDGMPHSSSWYDEPGNEKFKKRRNDLLNRKKEIENILRNK